MPARGFICGIACSLTNLNFDVASECMFVAAVTKMPSLVEIRSNLSTCLALQRCYFNGFGVAGAGPELATATHFHPMSFRCQRGTEIWLQMFADAAEAYGVLWYRRGNT
jgi:hypothetical protein